MEEDSVFIKVSFAIDKITTFAGYLAASAALFLAILIFYDTTMRYLFNEGSVALQELEWHLFDIIFLLGLSYALKHNKHVRVDILYSIFSRRIKNYIHIVSMIFFVIPLGILVLWFSWDFMLQSFLQNEASPNPGGLCCRYLIKSIIFFSFFLLTLQAISETIKALYVARNLK